MATQAQPMKHQLLMASLHSTHLGARWNVPWNNGLRRHKRHPHYYIWHGSVAVYSEKKMAERNACYWCVVPELLMCVEQPPDRAAFLNYVIASEAMSKLYKPPSSRLKGKWASVV
jgi:hypothetical protein